MLNKAFLVLLGVAWVLDQWLFSASLCIQAGPAGLIVGLVATAASAAMQAKAASDARNEAEKKTKQELARQLAMRNQAKAEFAKSVTQSGADVAQAKTQEGAQEVNAQYEKLQSIPMGPQGTGATGATTQTVREEGTKKSIKKGNANAAQMFGMNEWQLDQMVKNLRAQQELNILSQGARNSSNVLPLELDDASHSADGLKTAAQWVGLLGQGAGALSSMRTSQTTAPTYAPAQTYPAFQSGYGGLWSNTNQP